MIYYILYMSFQKQRKRFIKNNIKYIGKIELDFLKEYNITEVIKNCGKLKNKCLKEIICFK